MSSSLPQPTILLSYNQADKDLVHDLVNGLSKRGLQVLYAKKLVNGHPQNSQGRIDAIKGADCVLGLITPNSLALSDSRDEQQILYTTAKNIGILFIPLIHGGVTVPSFVPAAQSIHWHDRYEEDDEKIFDQVASLVKRAASKRESVPVERMDEEQNTPRKDNSTSSNDSGVIQEEPMP